MPWFLWVSIGRRIQSIEIFVVDIVHALLVSSGAWLSFHPFVAAVFFFAKFPLANRWWSTLA
jgi:hypothetical protein